MAMDSKISDATILVVEVKAIKECLVYCKNNYNQSVEVETNSWNTVQIIHGNREIPRIMAMEVNFIKELMKHLSIRVIHSHQKGNTLVDFCTNLVFDFACDYQFNNIREVPARGKSIIELEKQSISYIIKIIQND